MSKQHYYKILARKYRPNNFNDLIGQEVLVRTLSNAVKMGRIAHTFLLSGIRGVGKTTTARIIAKTLNCTDLDNTQSVIVPCGKCANCLACAEERHPDIIEMDAASRTGVGDVREIIESVNYLPLMGKVKIYIIDEIHMLSTNAFNALLKTIEEPPAHTKFIFATTEVRKIPITILSRCQRFDLKRLSSNALVKHLENIAELETVQITKEALELIVAKAEGSVRDSLSLMDQAISCSDHNTDITVDTVRQMLGMSCRVSLFNLLEFILSGSASEAIELLHNLYYEGVSPIALIEDLLDITHLITKIKMIPSIANSLVLPEFDRKKASELSKMLEISSLTIIWQMLLKGLTEVKNAPIDINAVEMVLIRLCHIAQIPSPLELIGVIETEQSKGSQIKNFNLQPKTGGVGVIQNSLNTTNENVVKKDIPQNQSVTVDKLSEATEIVASKNISNKNIDIVTKSQLTTYEELVGLFYEKQELIIHHHLVEDIRPIKFSYGELVIKANNWVPKDIAKRMKQLLLEWTNIMWSITETHEESSVATISEQKLLTKNQAKVQAKEHPVVKAVIDNFDGADVIDVREIVV